MNAEGSIDGDRSLEALPVPHRCPMIVQYMLLNPLRRLLEPPDRLLGPYVREGMTVVEPGCGFGYWTLPLARRVGPEGTVVAVDVEPKAVSRLVRRARRAGLEARLDASPCASRDLGLGAYAGRADLVVALHTLHEFEDLPGFLAQARALLRPGGRLLVLEPSGHVTQEQFEAQREQCRAAGFLELERPDVGRSRLAALFEGP